MQRRAPRRMKSGTQRPEGTWQKQQIYADEICVNPDNPCKPMPFFSKGDMPGGTDNDENWDTDFPDLIRIDPPDPLLQ